MKLVKTVKFAALAAVLVLSAGTARPAGRDLYPEPARAKADLAAALRTAAQTHKRVLVDFGGNWCADCKVLDIYFHNARNLALLEGNFILVHVNVGQYDANLDLASRYQIPLEKGVPALAVLSDTGKLLHSQRSGEFAPMGRMDPAAVTTFLMQWKAAKAGCSAVTISC